MRRVSLALIFGAALVWGAAPAVAAGASGGPQSGAMAPQYMSSDPENGSASHEPPESVSISFSEPLGEGSSLRIYDPCANRIDDKQLVMSANEMSIGLAKTPSGIYEAQYVASGLVSATGESRGTITFTVHGGKACGPGEGQGQQGPAGGGEHSGHEGGGGQSGGGQSGGGQSGGNEGAGHGGGAGSHGSGGGSTSSSGSNHSSGQHSAGSSTDAGGAHSSSNSSSAGHSSSTHSSPASGNQSSEGHGSGKHGGSSRATATAQDPPAQADSAPGPFAASDDVLDFQLSETTTVLTALAAASLFGLGGGWIIRRSPLL